MHRDLSDRLRAWLCLAALGLAACGDEGSPPAPAASSAPAANDPVAAGERRRQLVSYRPLLDEAARAELRAGGLLIDFGTPDQHKYTRGGWRSGWSSLEEAAEAPVGREAGAAAASATSSKMTARRAWIDLAMPAGGAPRSLVLRARSSVPGQQVTFHAGGRQLGAATLASEWAVLRAKVAGKPLPAGGFRLELRAAHAGAAGSPAAELDWLWLAADSKAEPPPIGPRVGPVTFAGIVRRSIVAPTARTYSFYLTPPAGASFVADVGAGGRATFAVSVTADGAPAAEIGRHTVSGGWSEQVFSLGAFAGRPIRLDLTTSAQSGEAGWGEPEIVVAANSPAVARALAKNGIQRPKNVVVIVIDTARADAFGPAASKDRIARTPRYDRLAAASTVFLNAYNNENWTKPSVATLLSGLYPSTHDTKRDASHLPGEVELVSQRLKKDGYATAGFVANGYISEKFGFERGWDRFRNYIRDGRPSEAEHVYRDALAWLREHRSGSSGKPFFLYIQTIDPHVRYEVGEKYWRPHFKGTYRGPLGPSISAADQVALSKKKIKQDRANVAWLRALYYGEIAYHDEQMGRFLDELDRLGVREETLLVVTNDHGEELGERGRFGHGHQVFEEMVRAPLLISYPPLFPAGARIEEIVEHVDLAPTLLDALGRDPLVRADGQSFLPLVRGQRTRHPRYAIIEFLDDRRLVRVDRHKLLVGAGGANRLFDLASDPDELDEVSASRPIARRLCEVHLGEGLAVPDKGARMSGIGRAGFRAGTADIDPAMRRQLEALGYFGSDPGEEKRDRKNN